MNKYFSKGSQLPISNCTKFNMCYFDFKPYEIAKLYEIAKPYSTNCNIYNKLRYSLAENDHYLLIKSKISFPKLSQFHTHGIIAKSITFIIICGQTTIIDFHISFTLC